MIIISFEYAVYYHELPDGRKYVGATTDIKRRFRPCEYLSNRPFHKAIEQIGGSNIKHIVVCEHLTPTQANKLEKELIKKFNSTDFRYGFNVADGGGVKTKKNFAPLWSRNVQKVMLDKGMKKIDLARALKVNYTQMCNVMSGTWDDEYMKWKILDYFKIKEE